MSQTTAAAVIRMCNAIWDACPWAEPPIARLHRATAQMREMADTNGSTAEQKANLEKIFAKAEDHLRK